MAGLVPAIHVFGDTKEDVGARDKPGHDEKRDDDAREPAEMRRCKRQPDSRGTSPGMTTREG
jgi:hypothetical protein